MSVTEMRAEILERVARYADSAFPEHEFVPDDAPIPVAGRVLDSDELVNLVDAALEFWLSSRQHAMTVEHEFACFLGVRLAMLCNSGSSANLLAVAALT